MQDHPGLVEHVVAEIAVGDTSGVVAIVDVVDDMAALTGPLACTARLNLAAVGPQFAADMTVCGVPEPDLGVRRRRIGHCSAPPASKYPAMSSGSTIQA